MISVFANGPETQDSIPSRVIPKIQKWYLMFFCLTINIITYGSKVIGVIQEKELRPFFNLGEVAIKKEAFGSPSTTVGQLYIYIYIYI